MKPWKGLKERVRTLFEHDDFRAAARRKLPKGLFEFIDRGTEGEYALRRNGRAFDAMTLTPRALVDVSARDLGIDLFGERIAMPLAIAPTGAAGLLWHRGEVELARAARVAGIPFSLATASITSLEKIADEAGGRLWFQLYMWPDRSMSHELVRRAEQAGYEALIVTVDTVVTPNRSYNARNGFSIPLTFNPRVVADVARRPGWLLGVMGRYMLAGGMPRHENYPAALRVPITAGLVANPKNETMNWDDLRHLRRLWKGPMIVKGILHPDDARTAIDCGADGLIISNHGGRNFDSAPAPLAALPAVVDAVQDRAAVMLDGGITRGSDIAKALALGAKCVLAGRAPLWGLAAEGQAGVERVLDIFRQDFDRTLAFLGVTETDVDPSPQTGAFPMKVIPKSGTGFGATVQDIDLTGEPQIQYQALEAALATYGILHVPGQDLSDDDQLALSGLFGSLNISFIDPDKRRHSDLRLNEVSNLRQDGSVHRDNDPVDYADTNLLWHTDLSFKQPPARLTFLNARELPRNPPPTEFCDLRAAWDALPAAKQAMLRDLEVEHCGIWARSRSGYTGFSETERAKVPPVRHPLVRTHARSGRTSLYLSSSASHVIGWPVEEGRALLDELMEFGTQDRFLYRHSWTQYDLLIWDDSATVHRAVPFAPTGERRVLRWSAALEPEAV